MRWLAQLRIRIAMLFNRGKSATRLDDELSFHIERQTAENVAAGMTPEEARYAALRIFGNPALLREQTRAVWSWNMLENLLRDLRIGVRTLFRSPGFSIIATLVMGLVHRRHYLALHGCAFGTAEASSLSRSRPAGYAL